MKYIFSVDFDVNLTSELLRKKVEIIEKKINEFLNKNDDSAIVIPCNKLHCILSVDDDKDK